MKRSDQDDSKKGGSWVIFMALALAAAAVAGADLIPPWATWGVSSGLLLLGLGFLAGRPRLRRMAERLAERLFPFWLNVDQKGKSAQNPGYPRLIPEQCELLDMPLSELARESKISGLAIRFFATFPNLIPRTDYLEQICDALMMPIEHLEQGGGGSYGYEYTFQRLRRYSKMPDFAEIIRLNGIEDPTLEELDEMVKAVEDLRREHLNKTEGRVS